jgi:leucyl-tRNA synthetase
VYQAEGLVNWDPVDQTVLANEQVDDQGRSWRSGAIVEKKKLKQWYIKLTALAEQLQQDLNLPQIRSGWPRGVSDAQSHWIGKTQGIKFDFPINDGKESIALYTTCPEVVYGATFIAIAPTHPLLNHEFFGDRFYEIKNELKNPMLYESRGKIYGFPLRITVQNPFTMKRIPVFVANYVLGEVGTGAIIGVPAHSTIDFAFAQKYGLPIINLATDALQILEHPTLLPTTLRSSRMPLNLRGKESQDIKRWFMTEYSDKVQQRYRLKDWLISRQRYWGTPIPLIHCPSCGVVPLPESILPVQLPDIAFKGDIYKLGGNPLAAHPTWRHTVCPKCQGPAERETDTMDTFVDSSWYFLRFIDPHNKKKFADTSLMQKWLPVATYVGGVEHATSHLLYARFIYKFLQSIQEIPSDLSSAPFEQLITQGMVHGKTFKEPETQRYLKPYEVDTSSVPPRIKDSQKVPVIVWEKMSKSKWNGVEPQVSPNRPMQVDL